MKVEDKDWIKTTKEVFREALEELGFANYKPSQMTNSDYWLCTNTAMKNYADQFIPTTTTETLQAGDYTKCDKFSEWVALFEIEDGFTGAQSCFQSQYTDFDGFIKFDSDHDFVWGKGSNKLPYSEFKQRAENTFKTK